MFTGIVEEIGRIQSIQRNPNSLQFTITCKKILADVSIGDSISVDGVCLTVRDYTDSNFSADVMPETVKSTTLHKLEVGSSINLERAMAANSRFGGHFVSGHVDGTGEIISIKRRENAIYMEIEIDPNLLSYFIEKGSVTVDGTSLTVFGVTESGFVISLIPVTQSDSIIGHKQIGDFVNIECDMLAKYIENLLSRKTEKATSNITMSTLVENGFLN
ncbi:riboflavin synthase [Oceanobacillus sp. CAU 1775]